MRRFRVLSLGLMGVIATLFLTVSVGAGGFWMTLGEPGKEAGKQAAFVIHPEGCHDPSQASVSARAEGLLDGQRKSLELPVRQAADGSFVVERAWPSNGNWVIAVSATYRGQTRSALLDVASDGTPVLEGVNERGKGRMVTRLFSDREIEGALGRVLSP